MTEQYEKNGYIIVKNFLNAAEVAKTSEVVDKFHSLWTKANQNFYQEKAVNSAYLTSKEYLSDRDRNILFELISSNSIKEVLSSLPFSKPAFMNTQLFFNPVNNEQKNYWHRDPQYHLTVEQQKHALQGAEVIHFRLAFENEPGIELVPGTHRRWDTDEELNIRLEKAGHKNHQSISTGVSIPLNKGDLLVFSANMIHRGLYGGNRKALDILFCEAKPEFLEFINVDCLPDNQILKQLSNPMVFINTINFRSQPVV